MNNTRLYEVLNLTTSATDDEIKKNFRKLAIKWHPDKWVNKNEADRKMAEDKFKELNEAYSVLADPKKRKQYDMYGEASIKGNGNDGPYMNEDILREMFEGMEMNFFPFSRGNASRKKKEVKIPNIETLVNVNLQHIYTGATIEFEVKRYNLKKNKQPNKEDMVCNDCKGMGIKVVITQMGPGMMTQSQQNCTKCRGNGIIFPAEYFDEKIQRFSRNIPRGITNDKSITIENNGHEVPKCFKDQYPGQDRTNIILRINEERTYEINGFKYFRGVDSSPFNLGLYVNIEPHEAICGTYKYISFVNGKDINVRIPPGIIFRKGDKPVVVPSMGMPFYKQRGVYGDLYVFFEVNDNFDTSDVKLGKIWHIMNNGNMEQEHNNILDKTNGKYIEAMSIDKFKDSEECRKSEDNQRQYSRRRSDDEFDGIEHENIFGEGFQQHRPPGCAQQ